MKPFVMPHAPTLVAVVSFAAIVLMSACSKVEDQPEVKPTPEIQLTAEHPSALEGFQTLFSTTAKTGQHLLDSTHLAKLWFAKEFQDGENTLFVVFAQEQELDEKGEPVSCHGCGVQLDAITYVKKQKGWGAGDIQMHFASTGSWGAAPEAGNPVVLNLFEGTAALLIPNTWQGQGNSESWVQLLEHAQSRWRDIGSVELSADNSGTLCSNTATNDEGGKCFAYTGTIELKKGASLTHPDLVVVKKGTERKDNSMEVVKASPDVYHFDGKAYMTDLAIQKAAAQAAKASAAVAATSAPAPTEPEPVTLTNDEIKELLRTHRPEESRTAIVEALIKKNKAQSNLDPAARLTQCIEPAIQYGQYSSLDGGDSVLRILLDKCNSEYESALEWCVSNSKSEEDKGISPKHSPRERHDNCAFAAAITTQLLLKKAGK